MTQIMIPAWVEGTLQPVEKLAAHERGLEAQSCVRVCRLRRAYPDPAARHVQISHARSLGEHMLHASRMGRSIRGMRQSPRETKS